MLFFEYFRFIRLCWICDILELFIRYGCDIWLVDNEGNILFYWIVELDRDDIVNILLDCGVDVEVLDW